MLGDKIGVAPTPAVHPFLKSFHPENVHYMRIAVNRPCAPCAVAAVELCAHNAHMQKQGHFLREWRKHKGYTLEHIAERVGMTHQNLGKIERGKVPYSQNLLEDLAEIYGTEPGQLVMFNPLSMASPFSEDPWSLLQALDPPQRRQAVEVIKALKRTGTEG